MNLSLFIGKRYFFSKKSQRAINVVSMISMLGVIIGTGALIIVLSVFNGFESLVTSLYNAFDPDIKITAAQGKTFLPDSVFMEKLQAAGIKNYSFTLEENALVKYEDRQYIVTMRGVDKHYTDVTKIDSMMTEGEFLLQDGDTDFAVIGSAIAYNLQLPLGNFLNQVQLYIPRREATTFTNPAEAFSRRMIIPSGLFTVQQEFDSKYILVPLRFAREILNEESAVSSADLAVPMGANADKITQSLVRSLGDRFKVESRLQQHAVLNRIMKIEKLAVFIILTFIMLIATFNIVGSLTMLIIEKQNDITVLFSLGAAPSLIRRIFLTEGMMITFIGAISGLTLGAIICILQQQFGIVRLAGSGTFLIEAYPVRMQTLDFIYVFVTVFVIGFAAAWYPSKKLVERRINLNLVRVDE